MNKLINEHGVIKKGKVYREFMKDCLSVIIDDDMITTNDENLIYDNNGNSISSMKCPECQSTMAYIVNESSMACMDCGYSFFYQDFSLSNYANNTTNTGEFLANSLIKESIISENGSHRFKAKKTLSFLLNLLYK